ncbi:MAG: DUF481 domain-containing protein [Gammaproteobacteria bacterium]
MIYISAYRLFHLITLRLIGAFAISLTFCFSVVADEVVLQDGSRLVGDIKQMMDDKLVIDTAFASGLEVKSAMVAGISTTDKVTVQLQSGDRLKGMLQYSGDKGQQLIGTSFGDISLNKETAITGLWNSGMSPERIAETKEYEQKVTALKQEQASTLAKTEKEHQQEVEKLQEDNAKLADPWSGNIGLGISGEQGNTDSLSVAGRAEAVRDTGFDRVYLYLEGKREEQNQVLNTSEVITGASLEHDLNRKWFIFGGADFEKDEFENLDLRGIAKTGVGYFFIREPNLNFKGLAALGYQHETFTDGTTFQEGIVSLGYDFKYTYDKFWDIGHSLNYFPSLTEPASDYRLVSRLYTELPFISADAPWKIRFTLRNDYDNLPRPGIKKLDTSYNMNIVYDFK